MSMRRIAQVEWSRPVFTGCACAALVAMAITPALGLIDLEWRPAAQAVLVGETVNIGLYAVSDDGETNQSISAMDVILAWDPEFLELTGNVDDGPYDWMVSVFPNDSGADGLNETWADGDALYIAYARGGEPAWATPAGLLVTTIQFTALAEAPETVLSIPEQAGYYTETVIYDGQIPGLGVQGDLGSAVVTVLSEPPPGDCDGDLDVDLDDYITFNGCLGGPDSDHGGGACDCADLDGDEDVDLSDFAGFQEQFSVFPE